MNLMKHCEVNTSMGQGCFKGTIRPTQYWADVFNVIADCCIHIYYSLFTYLVLTVMTVVCVIPRKAAVQHNFKTALLVQTSTQRLHVTSHMTTLFLHIFIVSYI